MNNNRGFFVYICFRNILKNLKKLLAMGRTRTTGDSQVSDTGNELINAAGIGGEPFVNSAADKDPALRKNAETAKSNENPGADAGTAAGEPGEPGATGPTIPDQTAKAGTDEQQPGGAEITIDQNLPDQLPQTVGQNEPGDKLPTIEEQQNEVATKIDEFTDSYAAPTLADQMRRFAEGIAGEPTEVVEAIAKIAGEELLKRNPAPEVVNLTAKELEDLDALTLHEQREKQYGEGYVVAKNVERETIFTRAAWNNLSGNKDGWKEEVKTPPEVLALQK